MEVYHVKKGGTYPADLSTLAGDNGYLKKVPEPPTGAGAYTVGSKGEVTCTFNGVTYSSFGTSTGPRTVIQGNNLQETPMKS